MRLSLYHPDNLIPSLCSHAGGRDGGVGVGGWMGVTDINKLVELWLEQSKRKIPHTSGDTGKVMARERPL